MTESSQTLNKHKKSFVTGAAILAAAGIITKMMSGFFRIPLGNMIGAEGMAYYQTVYPIYSLLLVVATSGLPVAISKLISEKEADDDSYGMHRILHISIAMMLTFGLICAVVLFFGAEFLTNNIKDLNGSKWAMMAIAPALLFVPMNGALRGYFNGTQSMVPTALSQVVEQFFRVCSGLIMAYLLLHNGSAIAAAGAAGGASVGALLGLILLIVCYVFFTSSSTSLSSRKIQNEALYTGATVPMASTESAASTESTESTRTTETRRMIIKRIISLAIPVTLGAAIMPIITIVDVILVPVRLSDAGFIADSVRVLYGQLTGFASPIVNLPNVIVTSIAISIVPTIVRAHRASDKNFLQDQINLGIRIAMLISLPCTVGIIALARPILLLLYPGQPIDAVSSAPAMMVLALGIAFLSLNQITTGVLQGISKAMIPIATMLVGILVKILFTYVFTVIPSVNIIGAALGTTAAYVAATSINLYFVKRCSRVDIFMKKNILLPLLSSLIMGVITYGGYSLFLRFMSSNVATFVSILLGGVTYIVALFCTNSITRDDLMTFPKSEKLVLIYDTISKLLYNGK
ncbi:MAG: polysaccharide biosynthesis protein [Clostridiales Family XIII bacterium]|nr:polysaccharide biosynthesis protein [Clostridiales Family XIII bacterium]